MKDKLKMVYEHELECKSYTYTSKEYGNYDIGKIKYLVKYIGNLAKNLFGIEN